MDDLDHSIHIAENDWSFFYDESEECDLLQASLANPEDSGLSDLEDSENSSFSTHQQQTQRGPDIESDGAGKSTAEQSCTGSTELPEQLNQSGTRGPAEDGSTFAKRGEMCVSCPGGDVINAGVRRTNTSQTDTVNVLGSGETEDGRVQTGKDLKSEPDPHSCKQAGDSLNEPGAAERVASNVRAERERWFVTVNDSPAGQRRRPATLKKKTKQKKTCDGSGTYNRALESPADMGTEINKNNHESHGGMEKCISDLLHTSGYFPPNLLILQPLEENVTERAMDRGKGEAPPQVERVQSEESEDSAEFLSIHSSDSESCFSAAKSVEEPLHPLQDPLMETQHFQSSLSLLYDSHENTDHARDEQMCLCGSALSAYCEGCETTLHGPASGQEATDVPDDSSMKKTDMHSETPGPQMHEVNLSASACSTNDPLCPLPVPGLVPMPSSVVDSPETYAKAAGHTHPVYAISPFWDEMEKLTINDILQLRRSASSTLEMTTPSEDDILDTSDNADSDYFTQPDESKPEPSSCELSTSDVEEHYCQFVATNTSPYPESKSQQSDSSFSLHEEDLTISEDRETPVPLEDFAGQCFDSQEFQTLTLLPIWTTESRSMYSAEALSAEDFTLFSLLGNEESSPSRDKNADFKASRSLETLGPASVLPCSDLDAHYQISFPEIFQCSFVEDEANRESQCITMYDPEDISVAPAFDYTLCTVGEHSCFPSLCCNMEKPIPIFSCRHPTIRELTFPEHQYAFLSGSWEDVDALSPIRVASQSFISSQPGESSGESRSWKSLLSLRKIRFHDKGSIWWRGSGGWMFPAETEEVHTGKEEKKPAPTVLSEGGIFPASSRVFRELKEQQRILDSVWTKREGIFSTVKQSDMCLVCIAFASWVLKSSDPKGTDAWKAALLANVSALSAIQYLRLYMKRKNPP